MLNIIWFTGEYHLLGAHGSGTVAIDDTDLKKKKNTEAVHLNSGMLINPIAPTKLRLWSCVRVV
jgi:hypothetical protein